MPRSIFPTGSGWSSCRSLTGAPAAHRRPEVLGIGKALCALLLAAAILLGPAAVLADSADCDCKTRCPMHAQKLGCHEKHENHGRQEKKSMPCHGKAGVTIKSAGCPHGSAGTSALPSWRGIIPRELELPIGFALSDLPLVSMITPDAPALEPPPHPPKSLSSVA